MASETQTDAGEQAVGSRELRIDAAHGMRRAGSELSDRVSAAVAEAEGSAVDGEPHESLGSEAPLKPLSLTPELSTPLGASPMALAQHAANLADRLSQRLGQIDRRESQLNSQEAELEARIRNARMWLDQRESEIAERQTRLEQWETNLTRRQDEASTQLEEAEELAQRLQELHEREDAAQRLALDLEIANTEAQTRIDALDFETASCRTRQEELDAIKLRFEQRQRELDAREAKLYTEAERASHDRVVLSQQQADLEAASSKLQARNASLQECERRLKDDVGALEFSRAELKAFKESLDQRAGELDDQDRHLQFRQREIETALRRFDRLGIVEERGKELSELAAKLDVRASYIDAAEAMLAERSLELADRQRQIEERQLAFENRVTRERRKAADEAQQLEAKFAAQTVEANRREAQLDERQRALDAVAEELHNSQREVLETRLAVEETWLQLQGVLAPAALSRSVAVVRSKLADQFRLTAEDLDRRRGEIESVRASLAEQAERLDQHRQQLQQWSAARESDLESRARKLAEREEKFDADCLDNVDRETRWETERAEYQAQIQRLLADLRGGAVWAA